jgi:hypothetical protein
MLTLKQVNKEIAKQYPNVKLTKGDGYFYIYSDEPETALFLNGLFSTSIMVNKINHLTMSQWIESINELY